MEAALELDNGWRQEEFKVCVRRSLHCCGSTFTGDSGESPKEKRKDVEKDSILENTEVILNRMWVETRTVKAILMRFPLEMRNVLLDSRGKAILIKWQRVWLNCVRILVFCGR